MSFSSRTKNANQAKMRMTCRYSSLALTLSAVFVILWMTLQSSLPNGEKTKSAEMLATSKNVSNATQFKWRESLAEKLRFPVTKVILLSSNPRSGSSFLGDVLSPPPVAASYFYEPLRFLYESVPRSNAHRRR